MIQLYIDFMNVIADFFHKITSDRKSVILVIFEADARTSYLYSQACPAGMMIVSSAVHLSDAVPALRRHERKINHTEIICDLTCVKCDFSCGTITES